MIKFASAYIDRQLQVTLFVKDGTIDRACHLCDNCLSLSLDQHRLNEHVDKSCREVPKVLRLVQEHESSSWHWESCQKYTLVHLHDRAKFFVKATSWQVLRQSFLFVEIENQ